MELTWSGKALVVTLLFRLLFGGYLIGMDQYNYNDVESALTVLLIYGLIGIFATLFISGKKYGLIGIIGLDVIFIILQSVFTFAYFKSNSRCRLAWSDSELVGRVVDVSVLPANAHIRHQNLQRKQTLVAYFEISDCLLIEN